MDKGKIDLIGTHSDRMTWRDTAALALDRAKEREHALLRKGWRYVVVNRTTRILVPCDRHGCPTKEGKEKIRQFDSFI